MRTPQEVLAAKLRLSLDREKLLQLELDLYVLYEEYVTELTSPESVPTLRDWHLSRAYTTCYGERE